MSYALRVALYIWLLLTNWTEQLSSKLLHVQPRSTLFISIDAFFCVVHVLWPVFCCRHFVSFFWLIVGHSYYYCVCFFLVLLLLSLIWICSSAREKMCYHALKCKQLTSLSINYRTSNVEPISFIASYIHFQLNCLLFISIFWRILDTNSILTAKNDVFDTKIFWIAKSGLSCVIDYHFHSSGHVDLGVRSKSFFLYGNFVKNEKKLKKNNLFEFSDRNYNTYWYFSDIYLSMEIL